MGKIRQSVAKRFKKSNPKGKKNQKISYIKPGGKHLLTPKSPRKVRRLTDRKRTISNQTVKEYKNLI